MSSTVRGLRAALLALPMIAGLLAVAAAPAQAAPAQLGQVASVRSAEAVPVRSAQAVSAQSAEAVPVQLGQVASVRSAEAVPVRSAQAVSAQSAEAVPVQLGQVASAQPASLTCQGEGVDPAAKVRYRTEIFIKAPVSTVWAVQTDVERWPSWQQPVTTMKRLDPGPLRPQSQFRWTTPVPATPAGPATTLVITSTVQQLRHDQCIRWTGPAIGTGLHIDGVHVWNFIPVPGGVLVRTEESHTGPQVDANVPLATQFLAAGLEAWLTDLKTAAEARHC